MCGITGIAALSMQTKISEHDVCSMLPALRHRGPDDSGVYLDPYQRIGLGHTRLSIIDLAGGAQPMHNEDKTVWVTFNGEIFNYIELRKTLLKEGHCFHSHSDTEVIVHAYEQYGDDFVQHLNGQFAIALWDGNRQRLLLVRDRVGILPLFYTRQGERLLFASEIKALLPQLSEAPRISPAALDQTFTFWAPRSPNTLFENIFQLSPGHMLVVEKGQLRESTYWDWCFPEQSDYHQGSDSELAEQLYDLLADATSIRLRADVPVGAYLSGGLDSSALVALIRRHSDAPLKTFSIGFEDQSLDESVFQKQMIDHLGVENSRILCQNSDIAENFPATIFHAETAILRTAPTPMRQLSGLVRASGYKVVLTGEGADEALGGYDLFKEAKIRQFWARQPQSEWRPLLLKKLYPYLETSGAQAKAYLRNYYSIGLDNPNQFGFSHLTRWFTTAQCKVFFSQELNAALRDDAVTRLSEQLPTAFGNWHSFNRAQYLEAKTLMGDYLLCSQGDRMLMANSVEGRFPFLDHRVIEFANRLNPRLKMRVLNEKYLFKQAMKNQLPRQILERHKQPYRAPDIPAFFSTNPPAYVDDLLSEEKLKRYGYFDAQKVGFLLKKARRGSSIAYKDNMALVGVLSTQLCHYFFIEQFSQTIREAGTTYPSI
ncbi:MAG: asparagine synthase (glutamine-hydrolyzing) [Methylococcaceae bacterium]|nr:asparagine synthase (glutamine-hydrolyzing) [Methylococcaceae bacterium]MDD1607840.1 asparagine synthase (glutamine-hydrolyzing) [Methylococcaceae bacterium]MDD1625750.1 asparagine synthase (glutamine-hydrolyzing) [Methylococcaceae bacterium]OYV21195.1 MAG: asparagine synthase (glutamine-hydrolysing) [Methylococcaceae bacterium NSP1-2]